MLIFVFICKEMREWGAIWAAVGGILSDFSRVFLGRKGIFGAGKAAGEGDLGPGGRHRALCAPWRAEARPQNQDGKTLQEMADVGSRPMPLVIFIEAIGMAGIQEGG